MGESPTARRWAKSYMAMVLVAWAIRLAVVPFTLPEHLEPAPDHWRFAGETGRIARSITQGKGFSSPLLADTGPTVWMTPVYPYILAGVFRLAGVYTRASALAILALDCLFSALTCIPIFLMARQSFGERCAVWSGWAWAFFPYAIYFAADFIWATTLTTLLLATLFLYALQLEHSNRLSLWMGFGLGCGFGAMTDPIVLTVALPVAAWMALRRSRAGARWFVPGVVAVVGFAVVISPWFVRNYRTFGRVLPFRDNLGLELYIGNNGDLSHFTPAGHHPSSADREWAEFQQAGEIAYMDHKKQQALDYIRTHPEWFVWATAKRVVYMWTNYWSFDRAYLEKEPMDPGNVFLCTVLTALALAGLWRAYRRLGMTAVPWAIALFCFPLVYYVTHGEDYYRRPIDPLFVVLAVYAVVGRAEGRGRLSSIGAERD